MSLVDFKKMIFYVLAILSPRRKTQLFLLFFLMLFASIFEMISIGAIVPFLGVLVNPSALTDNSYSQIFVSFFGTDHKDDLVLFLTIIFCVLAIISGFLRMLLLWLNTKFSFEAGADISEEIYRKTLYQDYVVHISRNSSEIINSIFLKVGSVITGALMPLLNMITSIIIGSSIFVTMCIFGSWWALIAFIVFAFFYLFVNFFTKHKLIHNSNLIAKQSTAMIQNLQESLSGIRDVMIDGTQEIYVRDYAIADRIFRSAQSSNVFIGSSPRFIIESGGIVLIALLAFLLVNSNDNGFQMIPILGVLALGAQRLLPIFQQFYGGWTAIQGSYRSFEDAVELLRQPLSKDFNLRSSKPPIAFNSVIEIKNLSFRHKNSPRGLSNINFKIDKGEKIGIIGETGAGKSTLLDLIMGLLKPDSGYISVDGVILSDENIYSWHKRLAHVPQYIHISDATIAENIAFGVTSSLIDFSRVKTAAHLACIDEDISIMPHQYNSLVGERGVNLSGGQRQRIGIARALYKGADVIIFDEATSALDHETEKKVMNSIYRLNNNGITMIIVSHRTSTLKSCEKIIEVKNGSTFEVNSM